MMRTLPNRGGLESLDLRLGIVQLGLIGCLAAPAGYRCQRVQRGGRADRTDRGPVDAVLVGQLPLVADEVKYRGEDLLLRRREPLALAP